MVVRAFLHIVDGRAGTVPDDGEKAKLIRIAGRIPAEIRPEINVET